MTTPVDGVEGTQGKLFYWTRQGLSLADFEKAVEAAIARVQEAGGIAGITQIGIDLVTSLTQLEARQVIDAASTSDIGAGGGGGGSAINLPIAMTDVSGLPAALNEKSAIGHHHSPGEIDGLSADVNAILAAADSAAILTILDPELQSKINAAITGSPNYTALTTGSLTVTGAVSFADGSIATADISGLDTALANLLTRVNTYANAIPGSRFDIKCIGGIQPTRTSLTSRTDIFFDWLMDAQPSTAANYAIKGDGWRRESW
jgi:hypothetical protein